METMEKEMIHAQRSATRRAPNQKNSDPKESLDQSSVYDQEYQLSFTKEGPEQNDPLEYWKKRLSGYELLNLPTDKPRPPRTDYTYNNNSFNIDRDTSRQLKATAQKIGVDVQDLLLCGFYLVLGSFSSQKDLVVGTLAITIRKGMAGQFANPLVLREQIDPMQSLTDFARQTGQSLADAQFHSGLPFATLLSALGEDPDTSAHPLLHAMFGMATFGCGHDAYTDNGCDLVLLFDENQNEITGCFYYATELFAPHSIATFIGTYKHILTQVAAINEPAQNAMKIKDLSYLAKEEYDRCIKGWNDTVKPYPMDKTIHQLFEEQVTKTPNNPAVIFEGTTLTYTELNSRANRMAAWLRQECGIGPDDLVVLCLDRSELMAEAVLGVLKAGAAYVPVDPGYPEDRVHFVLEDTNTAVVLTQSLHAGKIPANTGNHLRKVCLDDSSFREMLEGFSETNPAPIATSLNLAYVIYTSGTTGKPKGAMLQHQGVVNRIVWMNNEYPLKETDRILQKTPYVFDVSVWELFWAHWYGAAIVYARPDGQKDNAYLAGLIQKEKITVIHFVPSMLGVFEEAIENEPELRKQAGGLRYLFCSGEALPLAMVRKAHELLPKTEIHNLYGPTEASVDVLYYNCNDRDIASVPIGKPVANTTMYILDEFLRPLPIGGIGELYIGGDGVARGYLNRKELTLDRFIANPFQSEQEKRHLRNGRLYKTGDLVRYLPDGNIEYLGRNDFQVKIRGFRIELGEIEARIAEYPGVRHAVVLPVEKNGSAHLAAYYVADSPISKNDILVWLAECLPEYMLPAALVHLDKLPQTINGKLDRRALPQPDFSTSETYRAPGNLVQKQLCEMYAGVLDTEVSKIGIDADFFMMGGSSLLALRLLSMVNRHFDARLSIADIFVAKTVNELAAKLRDIDVHRSAVVKLNNTNGAENLFMIHPGNAGCEVYISLAQRLEGRFDCYGIDSHNLYHADVISELPVLAAQYLAEIDRVQEETGSESYVILGWSLGGLVALEIAAILESRGLKDIRLFLLDTIISDERLHTLSTDLTEEELAYVRNQIGNVFEHTEQCNRYLAAQIDLSRQQVSRRLRCTKVILFKAMLPDSIFKSESALLNKAHTLSLEANNVEHCLETPDDLLQVVKLEKADHYNLLKEEDIILSHMLSQTQVTQDQKALKIKPEAWVILFLLTLIWGSSFILIKKGLDGFSPMQVGSLRICFAGLLMLPVAIRHLRKISGKALFYSCLFGLLNAGLPAFLFPLAETKVDSSTAGILNGLTPIFTLIVGLSFFRVPFNIFKLIGVVVGFLGASMLILFREGFDHPTHIQDAQLVFSLLLVLATCLYGFAGNVMKRHLDNVPGPVIASFAFGSFAIPSAIYLLFSDFTQRLETIPQAPGSLAFIAILGVFGSAIAVILQSRLAKQSNALFVSFVTYLIPFVAIAWGMIDNERIGIVPFVSLGIILAAIYISRLNPAHLQIFKLGR
jgi:amino acid adenylation domain-containing protein